MGFQKSDGSKWKFPVSDAQAYRQMGNAVVVPVVRALARLIRPFIIESTKHHGRERPESMQSILLY
uniref:DNA (cytosine-5-)-methyltransferase n=1 Tax=Amphimedon queenslandica TaxID=400682 RepID=A0A1X7TJC1_AMPQE